MSALAAHAVGWDGEAQQIKVLIADDHPLLLAGLRRTLEGDETMQIVGEARSGPELIAMVARRLPDVVVLDLRMPGVVGAECIEAIRRDHPEVKCVVLSAETDPQAVDQALNAGASAYVVKSVIPADIPSVIRQAANGVIFHSRARGGGGGGATPAEPQGPTLTTRERSILSAVASGKTTAVISQELWVSEHTIKFHLTNIYRKLGVRNRAGAVKFALENGLD
jgi:DNA-binding NarL/FixJ family response regulator